MVTAADSMYNYATSCRGMWDDVGWCWMELAQVSECPVSKLPHCFGPNIINPSTLQGSLDGSKKPWPQANSTRGWTFSSRVIFQMHACEPDPSGPNMASHNAINCISISVLQIYLFQLVSPFHYTFSIDLWWFMYINWCLWWLNWNLVISLCFIFFNLAPPSPGNSSCAWEDWKPRLETCHVSPANVHQETHQFSRKQKILKQETPWLRCFHFQRRSPGVVAPREALQARVLRRDVGWVLGPDKTDRCHRVTQKVMWIMYMRDITLIYIHDFKVIQTCSRTCSNPPEIWLMMTMIVEWSVGPG